MKFAVRFRAGDSFTNNAETIQFAETEAKRNKWNTVDSELLATSTNPIQNKEVQAALSAQNTALANKTDALIVNVNAGFMASNIY